MDVAAFLESLGLRQYESVFAENDIDSSVLADLTDLDLKELGVASLGHRKRLLTAIAALGTAAPSVAASICSAAPGERRRFPFSSPISPDSRPCPNCSTRKNCTT